MGVLLVKLLLTQILAGRTNWGSLGIGQNSVHIIKQPLILGETSPEDRKPGTLNIPPHTTSTEVRSFLGHLPIILYG